MAEIDESKEPIVIKGSSGSAITGISLTSSLSHVLVGDEEGNVLWSTLWAGEMNAKSIFFQKICLEMALIGKN